MSGFHVAAQPFVALVLLCLATMAVNGLLLGFDLMDPLAMGGSLVTDAVILLGGLWWFRRLAIRRRASSPMHRLFTQSELLERVIDNWNGSLLQELDVRTVFDRLRINHDRRLRILFMLFKIGQVPADLPSWVEATLDLGDEHGIEPFEPDELDQFLTLLLDELVKQQRLAAADLLGQL